MLGSTVVSLLWDAITTRINVEQSQRTQAAVYIDEVQDYLRLGDLGSALEQARGLGVSLGLAHQHLAQLSPALREAALAMPARGSCSAWGTATPPTSRR